MTYKRSQVEDALCRSNAVRGAARSKLLVRLKRLLDIDRGLAPKRGASQRCAFFSEEGPGKGQEASFQEYEVFALDVGLLMAAQSLPQIDVVEILRELRPSLEKEYQTIVTRPLAYYADLKKAERKRGPLISNHPIFITVTAAVDKSTASVTRSGFTAEILHGGAGWWNHFWSTKGKAATTLEITLLAHALRSILSNIKPRRKGRP